MKCLILGGAGFMGSHIVDALLARGHSVRVFDRPGDWANLTQSMARIEFVSGDFLNEHDCRRALYEMDTVVHLISTTIPKSSNENPVYDVETNAVGSLRLLTLALEQGVKKIIFSSSGGTVYGAPSIQPIPETHPTNPDCSYG